MRLQTNDTPSTELLARSVPSDDAPLPPLDHQLSASLPILRFPKPQGSQLLANWVSSSAPHLLQPSTMSDAGSLTDSAYEMIHGTDTESQDDRLTESTGSLSVSRPEDVHSLDGSENHYESGSDKESDDASRASSIRYADQALQNPSTQPPAGSLQYGSTTEGSGVVVPSIEFQEGDGDGSGLVPAGKISVKHAIREFNEAESSVLAEDLGLSNAPKRVVATVRQTMSQTYLSTEEPLRILYVGRADAQRGIVLKICSAIWVSPKDGIRDQDYFNRHREGVYNIVPISSFGPAPELDLMEASHYQIKVEHCISADNYVDEVTGDSAYCVTVDQGETYMSTYSEDGPTIQPKWHLPHIAVFYCAEQYDADAERTRYCAWSFMKEHGVPSIFINENQRFARVRGENPVLSQEYIDEHSVHLCLESRDPERPMTPQRFPIDYASFADIDARQMNRHLAYLTGLSGSEKTLIDLDPASPRASSEPEMEVLDTFSSTKLTLAKFVERLDWVWWIVALVAPILMSLILPFALDLFAGSTLPGDHPQPQPLHPMGVCVPLQGHHGGLATSKSSSVATSTTTVVISVTSTKTVQVSQAKPSTSTLASVLSFAGFLSDKPSAVPAEPEVKKPITSSKMTVCSVCVYSPTEFLVAIPSRNKAVWLAQGAIDIDVYRGEDPLKTKISSVDEGVLVELGSKDAYGVLNVSVVTTRKPKINETFQIDFGKTAVTKVLEAGLHLLQGGIKKVSSGASGASHLVDDMLTKSHEAASFLGNSSETVRNQTAATVNRVMNSAREHIARQAETAETLFKGADLPILQAQVASRLWWLRMQGRMKEYAEYERKASRLLKMKHGELLRAKGAREKGSSGDACTLFGMRPGSLWSGKGGCTKGARGAKDGNPRGGGWDNRWKKIVMGGE
ncbi:hypothetical protein BT67DRAFT_372214 [Trichocladium antarcticum]|uniref:Uncharacterized protein n=1 Tax=Trichocladium antarcticum TaxID=1450529 RepID=A0AAN6UQ73_9PEZI|nr:hypothetical protein BT67DRAFT_372214 [Trichocladium antarcticum]